MGDLDKWSLCTKSYLVYLVNHVTIEERGTIKPHDLLGNAATWSMQQIYIVCHMGAVSIT